ncbi:hypothetical protein I5M27_08220 [Adhaeribacter sp. BT258]|uniref:Uncharacterized protein n=1 Tax=Adhaeribacter terrigena TaxID=2793070 RepID=A0ABS1C0N9_9BACT|nr:hypothetical protein [Adhaeribacter terrigena]MBK0402970.1 hypothetical protein [Adhaeribacter terrigena]
MMQLNIQEFLQKLATETEILPQVREQVQAEIEKYEGMRLVLGNTGQNPEFTRNLLAEIDNYLECLNLIAQKFRYPQMALIKINDHDKPEINQAVLQILKKINLRN